VIFPRRFSARELAQLARGQRDAARALGCRVVGGNLSRGAELSITTTVIGTASRPVLRSGAEPGDELWLLGEIGLAAAGLGLLQRGRPPKTAADRRALRAFRRPTAELGFGLALSRRAHSAIDLSDGLAGDAAHLARASEVSLEIDEQLLLAATHSAVHSLAPELGVSVLDLALYGGEYYALLATGPTRSRPKGALKIGRVEKGRGFWLCARAAADARDRTGPRREAIDTRKAYQHRAANSAAR
jgi:thiamine-monophosphate kinase